MGNYRSGGDRIDYGRTRRSLPEDAEAVMLRYSVQFLRCGAVLASLVLLVPPACFGCSGAPYPILEVFIEASDGTFPQPAIQNYNNDPNASCNPGGTNPTTRLYFIDEDTSVTFKAMWNTLGNFTIQTSDSNITTITNQVAVDAPWWNGPALLPMDQISLLAGSTSAIPAFILEADTLSKFGDGILYTSTSDRNASNPMKQIVICVHTVSGKESLNADWNTVGNSPGLASPFSYPVPGGAPINSVFIDGKANQPTPSCLTEQMTCNAETFNGGDGPGTANPDVLKWMPSEGDTFDWKDSAGNPKTSGPAAGDTRVCVLGSAWDLTMDPKWQFRSMGVQWNWDATRAVYTSQSGGSIGDMSGSVTCEFPVPCEPFFIECQVSCLMMFCLQNAEYRWYEVQQTYSGGSWSPAALPTDGSGNIDTAAIAADTTTYHECRYTASGYFLRGSGSGAQQSTTLICVRDKTPPAKVLYKNASGELVSEPPVLRGRTGDLLVEGTNTSGTQDEYPGNIIEVCLVDNNPFTPYTYIYEDIEGSVPDISNLAQADAGYSGDTYYYDPANLNCQVMYLTELYDDVKATDFSGNFPLSYNFYKPKLVWARGSTPPLGSGTFTASGMASGVDVADELSSFPDTTQVDYKPNELLDVSGAIKYEIYNESGQNITDAVKARVSADRQRFTVPSGSAPEPAYSITHFRVPVAAFKEPLPLHLSRNGSGGTPGNLYWYPRLTDSAGQAGPAPYGTGGSDDFQPLETAAKDSTVRGDAPADITDGSAFDQASDGVTTTLLGGTLEYGNQPADDRMAVLSALPVADMAPDPSFGKMGTIEVVDDEPPDLYLYVTDTKYSKDHPTVGGTKIPLTYRFGYQKQADAVRSAIMDADGWCTQTYDGIDVTSTSSLDSFFSSLTVLPTLRAYDMIPKFDRGGGSTAGGLSETLRNNHSYEPQRELVFDGRHFADFDAFFADKETYDPSQLYPAELAGCWVDEDTRLLFHVVAVDNCFASANGSASGYPGNSAPSRLLERRETGDAERAGIRELTWEICDDGQVLGTSTAESFQKEYIFRNPNVDDTFTPIAGRECYVKVTARDLADNERTLKVHFFVQNNQMRFRSLEEKRRGWKVW